MMNFIGFAVLVVNLVIGVLVLPVFPVMVLISVALNLYFGISWPLSVHVNRVWDAWKEEFFRI